LVKREVKKTGKRHVRVKMTLYVAIVWNVKDKFYYNFQVGFNAHPTWHKVVNLDFTT
jgi:hypothetical protein